MTSKERVYAAIHRRNPDRTPRFIWYGETVCSLLADKWKISPDDVNVRAGNDVLQTWLSINGQMERKAVQGESFVDEWGITWLREGYYNTVVVNPLAGLTAAEIENHPFPDPLDGRRYSLLDNLIERYGKTHFIGADISGTIFEPSYHLRGMENLLVDIMLDSDECRAILDRVCAFSTAVALEAAKRDVDWIWLGDDIGTQRGMIMSPELWRAQIKPRMKKVIDAVRSVKPDMIFAYHSCGTVLPVIADLIEIGINVLNPIQESAADMDQKTIKQQFGHQLNLMCGPDTQQFMTSVSPDGMATETAYRNKLLSRNDGYIFAVSHTLQPDVPLENILAMLNELNGKDD